MAGGESRVDGDGSCREGRQEGGMDCGKEMGLGLLAAVETEGGRGTAGEL